MIILTEGRIDVVDITEEVANAVDVKNGTCHVFVEHTTCGITVNEYTDGSVADDIHASLKELVPRRNDYDHDRIDGNAYAHIRSSLLGHEVTVPIDEGGLALGRWQRILLFEFDGGRRRNVTISFS